MHLHGEKLVSYPTRFILDVHFWTFGQSLAGCLRNSFLFQFFWRAAPQVASEYTWRGGLVVRRSRSGNTSRRNVALAAAHRVTHGLGLASFSILNTSFPPQAARCTKEWLFSLRLTHSWGGHGFRCACTRSDKVANHTYPRHSKLSNTAHLGFCSKAAAHPDVNTRMWHAGVI